MRERAFTADEAKKSMCHERIEACGAESLLIVDDTKHRLDYSLDLPEVRGRRCCTAMAGVWSGAKHHPHCHPEASYGDVWRVIGSRRRAGRRRGEEVLDATLD